MEKMMRMILRALALLVLHGTSALLFAGGAVGVVRVDGKKIVLSSRTHLAGKPHAKIYRLGEWKEMAVVTIGKGRVNDNSSLYNSDGENTSWEYPLQSKVELPSNTIWVCMPLDWTIEPVDADHLKIKAGKDLVGDLVISKGAEGINIDIHLGKKTEHMYYYLGYDI